ncbi:MAG: hypothetical protein ABI919_06130 [Ramlibacter sp.]
MKTPWGQALAWVAAVLAAILLALAAPDEASIERQSLPGFGAPARGAR